MRRTHLATWRTTLFVSLGLAASACGGQADSPGGGVDPEGGDDNRSGSGDDPEPPVLLAEHLRCENDTPFEEAPPGARLCSNGIVHLGPLPPRPVCADCATGGPLYFDEADQCRSDADCAPGTLCISSFELVAPTSACSSTVPQYESIFACQSPGDDCASSPQCGEGFTCALVGSERECTRDCPPVEPTLFPGRPFLVDAHPRTAGVGASADWCGAVPAPPEALDASSLSIAARHWQAAALMEHASIAAFARFTLQLLQLGAPLELVSMSQRAMRDETEHARRCFTLASRYAGAPLGPTTLDMAGAFEEESLASIVRLAFREGCVGETCAALEASEALALARDPLVRETLALITEDERRHAELAWRFVAWALQRDVTGDLHDVLRSELGRLRSDVATGSALMRRCVSPEPASRSSEHGVLGVERRSELRQAAITELVLPCAERLLAATAETRRASPGSAARSAIDAAL